MSAFIKDDECHHKQTFFIPPITQSMDTFTVGRELLSLSYVMGGIEKSCLQHKYSFPIALTARRNCKKISNIFHKVGNMRSRKVMLQHSSSFSTLRLQPDEKEKKIRRIK